MKLYNWQLEAADKWNQNGRKGIIKAVPGAGKTIAARQIISLIQKESPGEIIVVLCPTRTLVRQWESFNLNISVKTYYEGVKSINFHVRLLVLDECHSVQSPVRRKVLDIEHDFILGLSATPEKSDQLIGKIFIDIGWKDANISPFKIHPIKFYMNSQEDSEYKKLTNKVKWAIESYNNDEIKYDQYMSIIMKRRSFVYELNERISLTLQKIKECMRGKERIVIFSERLEQLRTLGNELVKEDIKFSTHTSYCSNEISDFISHRSNILLTSKMIKEGFDDPSITTGIMMSSPLSERNYIQTIGRMVRSYPGKEANIYILLAVNTTDEKLGKKSVIFGERYSLDTRGGVFIKKNGERIYLEGTDSELLNILRVKGSGRFWINSQGEVHTKIDNEVKMLGMWKGKLS